MKNYPTAQPGFQVQSSVLFTNNPLPGDNTQLPVAQSIDVVLNPNSIATNLLPGQPVKLLTSATSQGLPVVDILSAPTDVVFGIIQSNGLMPMIPGDVSGVFGVCLKGGIHITSGGALPVGTNLVVNTFTAGATQVINYVAEGTVGAGTQVIGTVSSRPSTTSGQVVASLINL